MELLGSTKLGKSISGYQELVDLVAEQVELDHPFSPGADEESELLDRLINCVRHALPYFSVSTLACGNFIALEKVGYASIIMNSF